MGRHAVMSEWNHTACGSHAPRLSDKLMNSIILQPWFVPRSTFLTIARLVPREYHLRMRDFFNRYGCMRCRRRTRPYCSNAMCSQCHSEVGRRLRRCWNRRLKKLNEQARKHEIKNIVANAKTAHDLLRDLIPSNPPNRGKAFTHNPANDLVALTSRTQRSRS